jgi:hypothetical protein
LRDVACVNGTHAAGAENRNSNGLRRRYVSASCERASSYCRRFS